MLDIFATLDAKWNVLKAKNAEGAKQQTQCDAHHPSCDPVEEFGLSETSVIALLAFSLEGVRGIRIPTD